LFRHTFATNTLASEVDIRIVHDLVGALDDFDDPAVHKPAAEPEARADPQAEYPDW
jgi:hypothetical protein